MGAPAPCQHALLSPQHARCSAQAAGAGHWLPPPLCCRGKLGCSESSKGPKRAPGPSPPSTKPSSCPGVGANASSSPFDFCLFLISRGTPRGVLPAGVRQMASSSTEGRRQVQVCMCEAAPCPPSIATPGAFGCFAPAFPELIRCGAPYRQRCGTALAEVCIRAVQASAATRCHRRAARNGQPSS